MGYDIGVSTSQASAATSGAPIYVDAAINFAPVYPANVSQTGEETADATAVATTKSPGAGTSVGTPTNSGFLGTTASGSSSMLWIVLFVAGAGVLWFVLKK
jgi:hypothetical protein